MSYSQTSNGSIPSNDRAKLITLCEAAAQEVEILRGTLQIAYKTLDLALTQATDERTARILTQEQMVLREKEIANLREAYNLAKEAYDFKTKEVAGLKEQINSLRKRKNFFKQVAKIAVVAAISLGAVVVLQNK